MGRVFLTPTALQDLGEIRAYLGTASETAADRVTDALERAVQSIGRSPSLGHRRRDLTHHDVWFYRVFSYFIVYRKQPRQCEVVAILHTSRDAATLLGRRG